MSSLENDRRRAQRWVRCYPDELSLVAQQAGKYGGPYGYVVVFLAEVAVNVFSSFGPVRVADVVVGSGSRMPAVVAA